MQGVARGCVEVRAKSSVETYALFSRAPSPIGSASEKLAAVSAQFPQVEPSAPISVRRESASGSDR